MRPLYPYLKIQIYENQFESFTLEESRLLDNIGTAYMTQELERRVLKITQSQQANMIEKTGVQSSLSEDDVKEYLHEVLKEVKKEKVQKR